MRGSTIAGVVVAAAAVPLLAPLAGAAAPPVRCVEGPHRLAAARIYTLCGPARAVVTVDGRTTAVSGGRCTHSAGFVSLNLGALVQSGRIATRPNWFRLFVGHAPGQTLRPIRGDGRYRGTVDAVLAGRRYLSDDGAVAVALGGRRSLGSFRGALRGGAKIRGTFTCVAKGTG